MYEEELHSCRRKARTGSAGIDHLNHILVPLVKENRQTIGHIYAAHGITVLKYQIAWYFSRKGSDLVASGRKGRKA